LPSRPNQLFLAILMYVRCMLYCKRCLSPILQRAANRDFSPTFASLQNIRLSSDIANPLGSSRNWRADGDGCRGGGLKGLTVERLEASPGEDR
jgi:hypothetical protein